MFLIFFFGILGMAYLYYGKKQQSWTAFLSGLGLCTISYFISKPETIIIVGLILIIIPFLIKI